MDIYLRALANSASEPHVLSAIECIRQTIAVEGMKHCALSFNGGKDCTVLLHLIRAALAAAKPTCMYHTVPTAKPAASAGAAAADLKNEKSPHHSTAAATATATATATAAATNNSVIVNSLNATASASASATASATASASAAASSGNSCTCDAVCADLKVIYFHTPNEFPAVQQFMDSVVNRYRLQVLTFNGSYKDGLIELIKQHSITAILMGQRRGDPDGADLQLVSMSSSGWPSFLRINPILEWSYTQVWSFLRSYGLEYCALYDAGYTSLGSTTDTLPNPQLRIPNSAPAAYRPAYELTDESSERCGRPQKQKPAATAKPHLILNPATANAQLLHSKL